MPGTASSDVVARRSALHARGAGGAAATFDAEGRLLSFRLGVDHFRRGLDGTVVRLVPGGAAAGNPWRARREERPDAVLDALRAALGDIEARAATVSARRLAGRAARGLAERWAGDVRSFRAVLGCVPIVPPLHAGGVAVGVVVLVGAGGAAYEEPHRRDTVALVGDLGLRAGDVVLVSPLDEHARAGAAAGEHPLDETSLAAATARLGADLEAAVPRAVRVSDYGLEGFVY